MEGGNCTLMYGGTIAGLVYFDPNVFVQLERIGCPGECLQVHSFQTVELKMIGFPVELTVESWQGLFHSLMK